jgi:hypothetical protein
MFRIPLLSAIAFLPLVELQSQAQADFQNLNFEETTIPQNHAPGFVSATDAFPGWSVYYGKDVQSEVLYGQMSFGFGSVSLVGTNGPGYTLEGEFSAFLNGAGGYPEVSISQTGLVPVFAESLLFKAVSGRGPLVVLLDGQSLPFYSISTEDHLYGADISAFAGQSVELKFSALQNLPALNFWSLDAIQFSTQVIPEPGTLALSVFGSLILFWRFRFYNEKGFIKSAPFFTKEFCHSPLFRISKVIGTGRAISR